MEKTPKFERPATPEEENALLLARNEYLLEHIKQQDIDITGAFTKKRFTEELDRALHKMEQEKTIMEMRAHPEPLEKLSLIMMDIDHFKEVNDRFGHPAGDAALVSAAGVLMRSIREGDAVGRWGGEEFILMLRGADMENARQRAEELRSKIEHLAFPDPDMRVTASFGVACSDTSANLTKDVDKALYEAKGGGRNRVETYEPLRTEGE